MDARKTDTAPKMTVERLAEFSAAWTRHDLEALMSFVTEDCVYSASVGPEPGKTYAGREEVRRGFAEVLAYDAGRERRGGPAYVFGDRGAAEWSFIERDAEGREVEIRGCDLFEFSGDKIRRKDAFRKVFA